jgi:hypothetical protein
VSEVLAQLMRQAGERGADLVTLRAIAEEAGELGATRALTRAGLADEGAKGDLAELRELLGAWRDAKRSAWKGAVGWVVRLLATLLLAGIALRLGWEE